MSMFGIVILIAAIVYSSYVQIFEQDRETRKEIKDAEKKDE